MSAKDILAMIKEKEAVFVDFRFTDPRERQPIVDSWDGLTRLLR